MDAQPLPKAYLDMLGAVPEQFRGMVQAGMEAQIARPQIMQQQVQQQVDALEQQRAYEHKLIDEKIARTPQDSLQFPAVQYDINRARSMADYATELKKIPLKYLDQTPDVASKLIANDKAILDDQYKDKIKPYDQTEDYKGAKDRFNNMLAKKVDKIQSLGEQTQEVQNRLDKGDKEGATSFAKMNLVKAINSAISDDAVGLAEMVIRYGSLLTASEQSVLSGKGPFNPDQVVAHIMSKPKAERDALLNSGFKDALAKAFEANPEAFIKDAKATYNTAANAYNKSVDKLVVQPTSKRVAASLGATPLPILFKDEAVPEKPQEIASLPPYQLNTSPTVTTGAGQAVPTQPQPQQQAPAIPDIPPAGAVRIKKK